MEELKRKTEEKVARILELPNVVGYSRTLKPKIVGRRETEEKAIRIYVTKKVPKNLLADNVIIPREVDGIPTDVVEIGEIWALGSERLPLAIVAEKTRVVRPLVAGVSIGNYSITAGTLGWFFNGKRGEVLLGSNAHVFADDVGKRPEEVTEKRIVQPGKYDGGTLRDLVAYYEWHQKIYFRGERSNCPVARFWAGIYNAFARLLGRETRLEPVVPGINTIDFAVARPVVEFEEKAINLETDGLKFVGLGFAGSDKVSVFCKVKNIHRTGYTVRAPYYVITPSDEGRRVVKTGRTTCTTKGTITDDSAVISVMYGWGRIAVFVDVALTTSMMKPGDSGSAIWIED